MRNSRALAAIMILIGIAVGISLSASWAQSPGKKTPTERTPPPAGSGDLEARLAAFLAANHPARYQIVMREGFRTDTWLLDTETGRAWLMMKITDVKGEPTVWMYMDRIDTDDQWLQWSLAAPSKPKE